MSQGKVADVRGQETMADDRLTYQADPANLWAQDPQKLKTAVQQGASASRGLTQLFGLHPSAAALTIIVDLLVFGGIVFSAGLLLVVGVVIAMVLSVIIYNIQRHWYGDTHESALIKAMIVGLLTAIPEPVTPLLAVTSGIFGVVRAVTR